MTKAMKYLDELIKKLVFIALPEKVLKDVLKDIREDEDCANQLKGRSPSLDTYGRDHMAMALVAVIMKDTPKPDPNLRPAYSMIRRPEIWHWPLNGDNPKYVKVFYKTFYAEAKKLGATLHQDKTPKKGKK